MNNLTTTTRSKILVLGATGGTGRLIVSQALERGHEVTALVRSPEKASKLNGARLVVGDVRDEKALREALKGQDAVVSALGTPASPFREVTLLSTATRVLVNAPSMSLAWFASRASAPATVPATAAFCSTR